MVKMGRVLHVDVLSILFGLGTWLCVNGLWVELPLLVQRLPEGWNLPSYLSVLVQLSNLGPLCYTLFNSLFPKQVTEKRTTYLVMGIGLVTTLLLANFWEKTSWIGGQNHSTALLVLVFFLASVDCSSRVLYLPFMAQFREVYLISYFIGEGLSGFVPSIVALVQGVGGNPECRTNANGTVEAYNPDPRFSIDVFFYFLFIFTLISLVAFYMLNKPSVIKGAKIKGVRGTSTLSTDSKSHSSRENSLYYNGDVSVFELPNPAEGDRPNSPEIINYTNYNGELSRDSNVQRSSIISEGQKSLLGITDESFLYLLGVQVFICFWANGVFPSIQSYSCLPYGNVVYHLTVTLSNMANPAVCFLAFFIPNPTNKSLSVAAFLSLLVSGYVLFTAIESPNPPFVGTTGGEVLLIGSWIVQVALFTYVRVSVATLLRTMGKAGLFWCGVVTQFGSALGALLAFFVVNYTSLFEAYYPCS